jgi:RNA-directed DNA polymerase
MKKRYDNIFEQIINENNIDLAYKKSQKGKMKYKYKSILFSQNLTYNLNELRNLLISNEYQPGKYNEFVVKEPKERIIFSPEYSDKIVHHAINNILKDIYINLVIFMIVMLALKTKERMHVLIKYPVL